MESNDDRPELFQRRDSVDFKLARQITVWVVVLGSVAGLGTYCYRAASESSALEAKKEQEEKEKKSLKNLEGEERSKLAIKSFQEFMSSEFPDWKVEGDSITDLDLTGDLSSEYVSREPIYFYAHISRNDKSRVVRLGFVPLKRKDGTWYWAVYRPTSVGLANIELEEIKLKEFKSGQESPP